MYIIFTWFQVHMFIKYFWLYLLRHFFGCFVEAIVNTASNPVLPCVYKNFEKKNLDSAPTLELTLQIAALLFIY